MRNISWHLLQHHRIICNIIRRHRLIIYNIRIHMQQRNSSGRKPRRRLLGEPGLLPPVKPGTSEPAQAA